MADLLTLNPDGLLAKLFGQGGRRPEIPDYTPGSHRTRDNLGHIRGSGQSPTTWDWYRSQLDLSQERLSLYQEYEEMDSDDLISSVLDTIYEDATQPDFMSESIVWVESENAELAAQCNATLQRLRAEDTVAQLARSIAKFGDNFEFLHFSRGEGVVAHEYYPPESVFRYEEDGQLHGFTLSTSPNPREEDLLLPWQFCHFMRPGGRRSMFGQYGDSWLRPSRRIYRKLLMSEDSMVMYRLRRAPDRDVYYVDVGSESPPQEQIQIIRMWRRLLKKNVAIDPGTGAFRSDFNPLAPDEDIVWPATANKQSRVERLSGSTNVGEIWDIEFLVNRLFSALRAPKDYFGFGDSGGFDRGKSLEQQDIRWARGIKSVQRGVTRGYTRILEIDLALRGIDPVTPNNYFVVKMAYPSALDELQRADLYDARLRSMEGLTRVVSDLEGLNKKAWFKFLLLKFGGFTPDLISQFMTVSQDDAKQGVAASGDWGLTGEELSDAEQRKLLDSLGFRGVRAFLRRVSNGTLSEDCLGDFLPEVTP